MASISAIDYDLLASALLRAQAGPVGRGEVVETGRGAGVAEGGAVGRFGVTASGASDVSGGVERVADVVAVGEEASVGGGVDDVVSVSSNDSSVELPSVAPAVSAEVRKVKFGGISDVYPCVPLVPAAVNVKYYADVIRGVRTKELVRVLKDWVGVKMPKESYSDLAVCTYTPATMPDVIKGGKVRLRGLAAIGDSAITTHVAASMVCRGQTVESVQSVRSRVTTDKVLSTLFCDSPLLACVSPGTGVDMRTGSTGATAFEAIVGVVLLYRPFESVALLLRAANVDGLVGTTV